MTTNLKIYDLEHYKRHAEIVIRRQSKRIDELENALKELYFLTVGAQADSGMDKQCLINTIQNYIVPKPQPAPKQRG